MDSKAMDSTYLLDVDGVQGSSQANTMSFSDADDSVPTKNLHQAIGLLSRRLEFDTDEKLTRQKTAPLYNSERRGAPDGHPTTTSSIQRSAFSMSSLHAQPSLSAKQLAPTNSNCASTSSLPRVHSMSPQMVTNLDPPPSVMLQGMSWSAADCDEPIDLSNNLPLDLSVSTQISESRDELVESPVARPILSSTSPSDNSADSFDSVKLFHKPRTLFSEKVACTSATAGISPPSSSGQTQFDFEESEIEVDVVNDDEYQSVSGVFSTPIDEDSCSSDDTIIDVTLTDDTPIMDATPMDATPIADATMDDTPMEPALGDTSSHVDIISDSNSFNPVVSQAITTTVQAIITNDSVTSAHSMPPHRDTLDQTYFVGPPFHAQMENDDDSHRREDNMEPDELDITDVTPIEVEPDFSQINTGAPASCFAMPLEPSTSNHDMNASQLNNSLNTTWTVKEAQPSPKPSLKLTLTRKSTSSNNSPIVENEKPMEFQALETWPLMLDLDLTPPSVINETSGLGSSKYAEESTIIKNASLLDPSGTGSGPCPATPDLTRRPRATRRRESHHLPTFPVSQVGQSSTPNEKPRHYATSNHFPHNMSSIHVHQEAPSHVHHDAASEPTTSKADSPRTKLLKKRTLECQGSDSVLNTGFRCNPDESKLRKKKKKKSLFKAFNNIKQQFRCSNETNTSASTLEHTDGVSQGNQRILPFENQHQERSWKQNFFSKLKLSKANPLRCAYNQNDTCPTTLFMTLSDTSTGMNSWCRHIRDVTRVTPVRQRGIPTPNDSDGNTQIVPSLPDNYTHVVSSDCSEKQPSSKTVGVSTQSDENLAMPNGRILTIPENWDLTIPKDGNFAIQKERNLTIPKDETFAIPKERYLTVPMDRTFAIPKERNLTIPKESNFAIPKDGNFAIPKVLKSRHGSRMTSSQSTQSLPGPIQRQKQTEADDVMFKKPLAPPYKKISSSKSTPNMTFVSNPKNLERQQAGGSKPLSTSTPQIKKFVIYVESDENDDDEEHPSSEEKLDENSNDVDSADVRIQLMNTVCRQTAEWLADFVSDNTQNVYYSNCSVQPNKKVLLMLCARCKIKVKWANTDSTVLKLRKTKQSRVPTEADLKYIVRATRRRKEKPLLSKDDNGTISNCDPQPTFV